MHTASLRASVGLAKSALIGLSAAFFAAVSLGTAIRADQQPSRPSRNDADLLKQKIATINAQAERANSEKASTEKTTGQRADGQRASAALRRTTVTENELNAYLVFDAQEQLPLGVVEPSVNILGTGRISGRAVVDLDAVRKQRASSSLFDPTSYLRGRLPVMATGTLSTNNGTGQFQLESASVGGIPIPKVFLQEIVSYYSRTPDNPAGIALEDPFALPARIREIQVERGQAVIVQ